MLALVNATNERVSQSSSNLFEATSPLMKAVSCIPLVGIVFTHIQERSIGGKIVRTTDANRLIELITLKNQYKNISIIRCLFTAVWLGVGSGLILTTLSVILLTCVIAANIYAKNKNNETINELQTTGYRPRMTVY